MCVRACVHACVRLKQAQAKFGMLIIPARRILTGYRPENGRIPEKMGELKGLREKD